MTTPADSVKAQCTQGHAYSWEYKNMKLQILSIFLILSILGCSQQAPPSLEIEITEAYAGETNAYLKGSVLFHGLNNIDFAHKMNGIRFRYFYVEDDDGLPRINQFSDKWGNVPENYDTYTEELNEVYPKGGISLKQDANILVLASICESGSTNEIVRVWCKKKINWKQ